MWLILVIVLLLIVMLWINRGGYGYNENFMSIFNHVGSGASTSAVVYGEDCKEGSIFISLTDRTVGGFVPSKLLYKKIVSMESDADTGKIFVTNGVNSSDKDVSRAEIMELLNSIEGVWRLPSAKSDDDGVYDGSLVHIKTPGRHWINGKPTGCVHRAPSVYVTSEQQISYNDVVERIRAFGNSK